MGRNDAADQQADGSDPRLVVGVDQSLTCTALHSSRGDASWRDAIKTSPRDHAHPVARLEHIQNRFSDHLRHAQHEGDAVRLIVIEGYAYGASHSHGHALGELGGALRLAAYVLGWTTIVVPPTTLKKFTTAKGNADKSTMQLHVFKRWGYTPIDDNDADAYALMKLGALWLRWQGDDAAATKAHSKMFGALEALHGKGSPSDSTPRVPAKAGRKAARHA